MIVTDEVISRCKQGDRAALAFLYNAYADCMRKVCFRIVGNNSIVDDKVHDGFIIIFTHIGSLHDGAKSEAWMSSIMTNLSLRYLKEHKSMLSVGGIDVAEREEQSNSDNLQLEEPCYWLIICQLAIATYSSCIVSKICRTKILDACSALAPRHRHHSWQGRGKNSAS